LRQLEKSARHALNVLLFCCSGWASASEGPDLERAESLVRQGRAAEAYTMLESLEFEHSGNANFDYWLGIAALESGRPDKATLALERALIVDPDFLGARLDLARAYFALGDMERAKQEFDTVLQQNPPPAARVTIDRYLNEIARVSTLAQTRWSGYLELTAGRDSNVNNSPTGSTVFVPIFGLDLTLARTSVKLPDWYLSAGGGAEVVQHLVGPVSAYGGFDLRYRVNQHEDTFDYNQADGRIGLQWQEERELFRLAVHGGQYRLDNKRHYENTGASFEWRHAFAQDSVASFYALGNKQRFPDPLLRGNSADSWLTGIGWLKAFNPDRTTYVFASMYGGHERDTDQRIDGARDMWGIRFVGQYNIRPAIDFFAIAGAHISDYDTQNFIFLNTRRDRIYEASLGANWRPANNWTVRPQVGYMNAYSNIPINKFDRYDISITLRRDFR
jgi:tetratricopeptide (TPR) repeat protein